MNTTTNMDDIQVSFSKNDVKPFKIYHLTPIDVFRLTEREAWQLTKSLIAALQGYNSKSI
jgi:hypothetical protein